MNRQKQIIFSAFSFLFTFLGCSQSDDTKKTTTPTTQDYDLDETALATQGFSKIYEENFTSDLSGWDIWTGGAYNEELQFYQPQNLSIANGILEIKPVKEDVTGPILPGEEELSDYGYTSGRIESVFEFAHTSPAQKIRISARMKLPAGYGMWPAFWSLGEPWPTHGEIDILEATGDKHGYTTNYYYGSQPDFPITNDDLTSEEILSPKDLSNSYHVYEVIWEKDKLSFLLDGELMETKTASDEGQQYIPAFFGKNQHIVLNLAIGGNMFRDDFDESKIQPIPLYVDWVKVFRGE